MKVNVYIILVDWEFKKTGKFMGRINEISKNNYRNNKNENILQDI